jgi:hypothetical protein
MLKFYMQTLFQSAQDLYEKRKDLEPDPYPDPYLWVMDPDPKAQKHADPQHCSGLFGTDPSTRTRSVDPDLTVPWISLFNVTYVCMGTSKIFRKKIFLFPFLKLRSRSNTNIGSRSTRKHSSRFRKREKLRILTDQENCAWKSITLNFFLFLVSGGVLLRP